ncbi:hypothetical protein Scep_008831 [Stephania cephalantha]|uniref:Ribosomal protein S6 n=1 Tax=Stephania cephalantha TaxID=152367 RepID=A0AAP0PFR0_9MAGN
MEALMRASSATYIHIKNSNHSNPKWDFNFKTKPLRPFSPQKLCVELKCRRRLVIAEAKNNNKKKDSHSFAPKPDEIIGPFPEAVLLKEKQVKEDGRALPEFADADEEELYEFLNLQLESYSDVERMRHYEVVYLIHENYVEEVDSVKSKIEDFMREKKGKVWRLNDWGLRRLAYKIKKAKNAYYVLMNFEMEAKWINDFKSLLDKDERVIRHLVIKRDEAITEDCPPPPEFHTLRGNISADDEEDIEIDAYDDEDDEQWDEEDELDIDGQEDDIEDNIIFIDDEDDKGAEESEGATTHVKGGRKKAYA